MKNKMQNIIINCGGEQKITFSDAKLMPSERLNAIECYNRTINEKCERIQRFIEDMEKLNKEFNEHGL